MQNQPTPNSIAAQASGYCALLDTIEMAKLNMVSSLVEMPLNMSFPMPNSNGQFHDWMPDPS
jgi:hypothetical protein